MKISEIKLGMIHLPLKTPFKTALRTVNQLADVVVEVHTDSGLIGYGEAAPTGVITGDTTGAIIGAIQDHIAPAILQRDLADFEGIMQALNRAIIHNTSAKAAVDMALWDLFAQSHQTPLYQILGGNQKQILTDKTISVNAPEEMVQDALIAVNDEGFDSLKIKVGKNVQEDLLRLRAIRQAIGNEILIRIDANQGWNEREAVHIIDRLYQEDLGIELIEQPILAQNIEGLKYIHDHSNIPILADEAVFSPLDALKIIQLRAADYVNIKLMKTGGIYNALKIIDFAELYGVECMIGCMLESNISVTAAAHLAGARSIISRADLDGPSLCQGSAILGGATFNGREIVLSDEPGLGITGFKEVEYLA